MSAFEQAIKISTSYSQLKQENKFLKEVIKKHGNDTIVFTLEGEVYFSTWYKENAGEIYEMLRSEIPHVISLDNHKMFRNINGTLFSIISHLIDCYDRNYIVFYVTASKIQIATGKHGIKFSNKKEAEEHFFNSFYSIHGAIGGLQDSINQISQSSFPVMIMGESGTDKEQIAQIIYTKSSLKSSPLITINWVSAGLRCGDI